MTLLTTAPSVLIRAARGSDGPALERLAALDSATVPAGRLLVAEADGELIAALGSGGSIADPFRHTADVVELLELRATAPRAMRPQLDRAARAAPGRARARRVSRTLPSPHLRPARRSTRRPSSRSGPPGWHVWGALWIVYVIWGSTYLAIRIMVETVPPLLGAGVRFTVAGAALVAVLAVRRGGASMRLTRAQLAGALVDRVPAARRQRGHHGGRAGGPVGARRAADRLRPAVGDPAAPARRASACPARSIAAVLVGFAGRRADPAAGRAVGRRVDRRAAGLRRRGADVGVGLVRVARGCRSRATA